jgi:DNA polymerase III epsilon subunit-like protein
MTEVMVDIETMSVLPNAAILTIGAVKFNRMGLLPELSKCDTFYRRITIDSCINMGLTSSPDTIEWWNNQDKEIKYEAFDNPDRIVIGNALKEFAKWFKGSTKIWGHGDDFDCVILSNAFRVCNIDVPWKFWNTRDTRTLFDLANISIRDLPQDNAHHALHDAYRQVIGVKKSLEILKVFQTE